MLKLAAKFKWINALIATAVAMSPQIMDYAAGSHWVETHKETYGMVVLLIGLFTRFYKHEHPTNEDTDISTCTDKGSITDGKAT